MFLVECLKDDWANGVFVGNTQEETGYRCTAELAKVTVLSEVMRDVFEPVEALNGE